MGKRVENMTPKERRRERERDKTRYAKEVHRKQHRAVVPYKPTRATSWTLEKKFSCQYKLKVLKKNYEIRTRKLRRKIKRLEKELNDMHVRHSTPGGRT